MKHRKEVGINMIWLKAALIRAIKTMAQVAVALLGTGTMGILDVDWVQVLSVAALAGVCSILTSLAGLPEVEMQEAAIMNGDVQDTFNSDSFLEMTEGESDENEIDTAEE